MASDSLLPDLRGKSESLLHFSIIDTEFLPRSWANISPSLRHRSLPGPVVPPREKRQSVVG